jgi:M6 family metalloprotease-like protein
MAPPSWAVGHIKPGAYPHAFQDKIHHPSTAQMNKFGSMHAAIIGSSSGTKKVAVIIVQFPAGQAGLTSGSRSIVSMANVGSYFTKMAAYYDEVSYHKIALTFAFFGTASPAGTLPSSSTVTTNISPLTLSQPMEYYGCGDEGVGCGAGVNTPTFPVISANGDYLIRDALNAERVVFSSFLNTTNFDAVVVVHAGNGNETTIGTNGDIWSIFYSQDPVISSAGAGFDEGDVDPETEGSGITSPLGVMCHEFGHELGLPDQYNTGVNGGSSVVGGWELMDSGPFDGAGANPSHMGIWDKLTLGWATPPTITTGGTVTMGFIETTPTGGIKLPVPNGLPQEYFLVEYRSKSSGAAYDQNIPGTGLLVWHIDDAITSTRGIAANNPSLQNTVNTGSPHYGISIITADGLSAAPGDAGNPFQNRAIFISPQSNNFAGQPSGVSMVNISGIGTATASAQVAALAVSAGQSISKVINYPNPAGKGYAHPNGEGNTTIQFQLTRPAQDYTINIYTLSGDLVRKIGKDDITLNITRSADQKWVYEYVWDLKNGDGKHVAPGVYLYLIRADGQNKSDKAVIIR